MVWVRTREETRLVRLELVTFFPVVRSPTFVHSTSMSAQKHPYTRICDTNERETPLPNVSVCTSPSHIRCSYLVQLEHDTVEGSMMGAPDMIPFWQGYRGWFNSFGISLYELRTPHSRIRIERWLPPPMTAPAGPPFAVRLGYGSTEPMGRTVKVSSLLCSESPTSLTIFKSKFGLGQDGTGHDVFIKITDKGSEEHRINHYLLKLEGTMKPGDCAYALCPVAVLDSPHNFSFIVMPW